MTQLLQDAPLPVLSLDSSGSPEPYWICRFRLARDVMSEIVEGTLSAPPPNYKKVLGLDRLMRDFKIPSELDQPVLDIDEHCSPSTYMTLCGMQLTRALSKVCGIFIKIAANCSFSDDVYTSQCLQSGFTRSSRKPTRMCLCSISSGCLSKRFMAHKDTPRDI